MARNPFLCGVVEGFYGRPWSAAQREQLFTWMKSWAMNTYIYAPKDDLKHRLLWRQLYSEEEAAGLKQLIRNCHAKGLRFVYGIAPGLDLAYSSANDGSRLRRKADQMMDLGCRDFAIAFDDIQLALPPEDARKFDSIADAQCSVTHLFMNHARGRIPDAALFFCPTEYCERMSGPVRHSNYLRQLGKQLDSSIQIFWTGPDIVSETITAESMLELQRVLRRKPVIWDNLHANDYDLRRLYLGPYSGRPPELRDEIAGILSNPNCEFHANYIPLRTLAMFARAAGRWNPEKAYKTALKGWLTHWHAHPGWEITIQELETLCDCFYLPFGHGRFAGNFLEDLQCLTSSRLQKESGAFRRLDKACAELIGLCDKITALKNRDLLFSVYRQTWELKEEVVLLQKYLTWIGATARSGQSFATPDRKPGIYRGGFVAELQQWLPMSNQGHFRHRPPPGANDDPLNGP